MLAEEFFVVDGVSGLEDGLLWIDLEVGPRVWGRGGRTGCGRELGFQEFAQAPGEQGDEAKA